MPWRETNDPYRIWLSEIMLQQTRVATVEPYYRRFLDAYPDVRSLADATEDGLMKRWEGLGYYSRARNLHRCARIVAREFGGTFPPDAARLEELPGIGRSTAAAVAAIAFGKDEAILDGNVKRVVSRLAAIGGDPARAEARERMWEVSRGLLTPGKGRETALAMMDLGAVVCTPRRPACCDCPFAPWCRALAAGNPAGYPGRGARRERPVREAVAVLLEDGAGRLLVRKRPGRGLLGGLWEFPGVYLEEGETQETALERWGRESGLGTPGDRARLGTIRHEFTHFSLRLHGWRGRGGGQATPEAGRWVPRGGLAELAFPNAHRKLIAIADLEETGG
jgi:A/G-specific adenine glycosylase